MPVSNEKSHVLFSLIIFSVCLLISGIARAASQNERLDVHKINDSFYILTETGRPTGLSSSGISVGKDGILVVDSLSTQESGKLVSTIRELSDKPVRYVFNTFVQGSRTGANNLFREMGAKIIRATDEYPVWKDPNEGEADISFDEELKLSFNGEEIQATRFRVHTPGDAVIYFNKSNVLFMGRTYSSQLLPTYLNLERQMAVYDYALNLADENTVIVPGNGKLSDKEGLQAYKKTLEDLISLFSSLKDSSHSIEEIINDKRVADLVNRISIRFESDNPVFRNAERWFLGNLVNSIILNEGTDKEVTVTPDILQSYTGKYQFSPEETVDILYIDGRLMIGNLRADIQYIYELTPLSDDEFFVENDGTRYLFQRKGSAEVINLTRSRNSEVNEAVKIQE